METSTQNRQITKSRSQHWSYPQQWLRPEVLNKLTYIPLFAPQTEGKDVDYNQAPSPQVRRHLDSAHTCMSQFVITCRIVSLQVWVTNSCCSQLLMLWSWVVTESCRGVWAGWWNTYSTWWIQVQVTFRQIEKDSRAKSSAEVLIHFRFSYCPVVTVNFTVSVFTVSGQRETDEALSLRLMGCSRCSTVRTRAAVKSMLLLAAFR